MKKYTLKEKDGKQQCQRCLQYGHWTYECINEPAYLYRPSRTQLFKNKQYTLPLIINEEPPEKIKVKGPEINIPKDNNSNLKDNNSFSGSKSSSSFSSSYSSNSSISDSSFSSESLSNEEDKGKMNAFYTMIQNYKKDKDKTLRKEKQNLARNKNNYRYNKSRSRSRSRSNSKNKRKNYKRNKK